jgi:hypothetical protein
MSQAKPAGTLPHLEVVSKCIDGSAIVYIFQSYHNFGIN